MKIRLAFLFLALIPFMAIARQPDPGDFPTTDRGNLILIGGGEKPREVMQLFIRLAGGPDKRIVILPMATADTNDTGHYYQKLFRDLGAKNIRILPIADRNDACREENVEVVRTAKGIWFSGGDQSRITERILHTPFLDAIREMKRSGGVVGGTSAGTACQTDPMLNGEGDPEAIYNGSTQLVQGLGLLDGVIVDQHFIKRRRHNRLLSAVLSNPGKVGIGIDEDTAIWVKPDQTIEVIGENAIEIIDARKATISLKGKKFKTSGVQLSVLSAGDIFSLSIPGKLKLLQD